jgi:predicted O-methyltransferase YrrM
VIALPESRFSHPRDDCPHPERWTSTDDDSTEVEVSELVAGFVRALQPDFVIETGTAFGQTAQAIGEALQGNGQGICWTFETDPERVETSRSRCAGLPVTVMHGDSLALLPTLPGGVGLAWLDSLIPLRIPEVRALRPKLRTGAIVGFHDARLIPDDEYATPDWRAYRPALEALLREGWLRGIHLPTPRGVMFAEVLG